MVNQYMPRTFGDGVIHESHIDAMVENCEPLHELKRGALSEEEKQIGKLVADNLVVDGATLQMGKATWLVEKQKADLNGSVHFYFEITIVGWMLLDVMDHPYPQYFTLINE